MKQRLKAHQLLLLFLLLAFVLACGATYAYMFMRAESNRTQFVPAKVFCRVVDPTYIKVQNDKDSGSNITAYLRVRLVTYWVDGDGNIVAKPSPVLDFEPASGWIEGDSNTYYYATAVAPDDTTTNLLPAPIELATDGECQQVLDIFAEAIQAEPIDAVEEAWGVTLAP